MEATNRGPPSRSDRVETGEPKGRTMSATTNTAPTTAAVSMSHRLRLVLVLAAIVVLLALTFVAGRNTGTTTRTTPAIVPTAGAPTAGPSTSAPACHMGRAC
jgi:hypothetical protein